MQQGWRTEGLYVAAYQLRALLPGFCYTHVARDASSSCCIVDSYQPFPLLHCAWLVSWYSQTFLLNLACTAKTLTVVCR